MLFNSSSFHVHRLTTYMLQVERHWSTNEFAEMTLEKLQMVATCNVTAAHKTKFLQWWNSSAPSREARKFPPKPVSENLLGPFLNKCCWYAGVSEWLLNFLLDSLHVYFHLSFH